MAAMFSDDVDLPENCFCGLERDPESDYYCSMECARLDALNALTKSCSSAGSSAKPSPTSLSHSSSSSISAPSSSSSSSPHSSADEWSDNHLNHYRRIQAHREAREALEAEKRRRISTRTTKQPPQQATITNIDPFTTRHHRNSSLSSTSTRFTTASYSTNATSVGSGTLSRDASTRSTKSNKSARWHTRSSSIQEEADDDDDTPEVKLVVTRKPSKTKKKLGKPERTMAEILEDLALSEQDYWTGIDDAWMNPKDVEAPFLDYSTPPTFTLPLPTCSPPSEVDSILRTPTQRPPSPPTLKKKPRQLLAPPTRLTPSSFPATPDSQSSFQLSPAPTSHPRTHLKISVPKPSFILHRRARTDLISPLSAARLAALLDADEELEGSSSSPDSSSLFSFSQRPSLASTTLLSGCSEDDDSDTYSFGEDDYIWDREDDEDDDDDDDESEAVFQVVQRLRFGHQQQAIISHPGLTQ